MSPSRTTADPPRAAGHLPALDGVRGLAILMVMWGHFAPEFLRGSSGTVGAVVHNLANAGWAGVDLFFVLSGFLITGILLDARGRPNYFRNFYARRTLRIFPLYYLTLACVAAAMALWAAPDGARLARDRMPWLWTYAANWLDARQGWSFDLGPVSLNHFWTLAVEEQFYLIWPAVVAAAGRRGLKRVCFGGIALAVVLRYYFAVFSGNTHAAFCLTPCRIDAFAVGGLLALAVRHLDTDGDASATRSAALGRAGLWMMAGSAAVLPFCFYSDTSIQVYGRLVLAVLSGGLILVALHTRAGRFFGARPMVALGKYSYGLYVLHYLLFGVCDRWFPTARVGVLPHVTCSIGLSFAAAWCAWHAVEKHFLALKRFFPTESPPAPVACPALQAA